MPASPRDVFDSLLTGIAAGRWAELADLYAEDVVVEVPFGIPEPRRLEGREQIHAHFTRDHPVEFLKAHISAVHETQDPEVIIAEFDYDLRAKPTGREFRVSNVQLLRVRDGLIVASRDYHNHWALAEAMR